MNSPKTRHDYASLEFCERLAFIGRGTFTIIWGKEAVSFTIPPMPSLQEIESVERSNGADIQLISKVLCWISQMDHDRIVACKTYEELQSALSITGWQIERFYRGVNEDGYKITTWSVDSGCKRLDSKMKKR